jgi:uncharacterized protein YegP (UPF0339 family)
MTFRIKKSKNGQFYFSVIANNNKIIATSEQHKNLADCEDTVDVIIQGAAGANIKNMAKG